VSDKALAHALEYGAFKVFSGLLRILPEGLAQRFGAVLGWLVGSVLRIRRDVVDENLERAFPDRSTEWRRKVARASYVHLGREAVSLSRMAGLAAADVVDRTVMVGLESIREVLDRGNGVVIVTGHLGNWEIGGAAFAARGLPLVVIAKGMANRRFDRALTATRERLGMRVVEMWNAPRQGLRELRSGSAVALVADQNAREYGVLVPFFGIPASTWRGPAVFSLRARCPLFVAVARREPGWRPRYRVEFRRIEVERTGDADQDVRALTEAHVAELERAVREAPEQYFWQHKRWRTPPPGPEGPEPATRGSV